MSIPDFDAIHEDPMPPPPPPTPRLAPEILQTTLPKTHKRKAPPPAPKRQRVGEDTDAKPLLKALRAYRDNPVLGPALKNRLDLKNLERLSPADLRDRLDQVDDILAQTNNSSLLDGVAQGTLLWAESAFSTERYNFRGTADALYKNDHWLFLLERVKVKYGLRMTTTVDPGVELLLVTLQTAMAVQRLNRVGSLTPTTDLERKIQV